MRPITTALLSYGMSGSVFHAPLLNAHPDFHLHTIVERTKSASKYSYKNVHVVKSVEAAINDPLIELVIVNTPVHLHYEHAKAALEAGKHVVVEKPFTANIEQAIELNKIAKKQNRILTVFHNRRWDSDFLSVKKVLDKNWLGQIKEVEIHFDRYRPVVEKSWKEDCNLPGTGSLYNLGSHLIDQALCLFGMPNALFADTNILRPDASVVDYFVVMLFYDTFNVILKSSYLVKLPPPKWQIHGTHGSLLRSGIDPQEEALKNGEIPGSPFWGIEKVQKGELNKLVYYNEAEEKEISKVPPKVAGNYSMFYTLLSKCFNGGAPPVDPWDAARVIFLIELIMKSAERGEVIEVVDALQGEMMAE
jgi:predicted dehydrogenase